MRSVPPQTIAEALDAAHLVWAGKPGGAVLDRVARAAAGIVGFSTRLDELTDDHGQRVVEELTDSGLSQNSVRSYYGAFRRALLIAGYPQPTWPIVPKAKRAGPVLQPGSLDRVIDWLDARGWNETADLARLVRGAGLRAGPEAMKAKLALERGEDFDRLYVGDRVVGARVVPIVNPAARALVADNERLARMRRTPYDVHVRRWRIAVWRAGVDRESMTLLAVRAYFVSELIQLAGRNIAVLEYLLKLKCQGA